MEAVSAPVLDSPFRSDTDAELLYYMSLRDEDPAAAEGAWAEFYRRHVQYLYGVCYKAYGDLVWGCPLA